MALSLLSAGSLVALCLLSARSRELYKTYLRAAINYAGNMPYNDGMQLFVKPPNYIIQVAGALNDHPSGIMHVINMGCFI
jgi:hypothetical protein